MKLALRSLFAVIVVLPASALASDFSDFRIPDHSWHSVQVGASSSYDRNDANGLIESSRVSRLRGNLSAKGVWAYDSEKLTHSLALSGAFDGVRARDERDGLYPVDPFTATRRVADGTTKTTQEYVNLSASMRSYPWSTPIALGVEADVRAAFGQGWMTNDVDNMYQDSLRTTTLSRYASEPSYDDPVVSYEATTGYGRVRDASGIFQAYLMEARLRRAGVLARPLSAEARSRLAKIFYLQSDYSVAHDRPDKFFWRDVESILRDDGALPDTGLDAYGLMAVLESELPSGASHYVRRSGFYVGAAVEGRHERRFDRYVANSSFSYYASDSLISSYTGSSTLKSTTHDDQVRVGADVQWFRPIGYKSQFDVTSYLRIPTRDWDSIDFSTTAVFDHVIADRWEGRVALTHRRISTESSGVRTSAWQIAAAADLYYFIEDRTRLSLHVEEVQTSQVLPLDQYARRSAVAVGITYFLTRGLDASGTIDPQRMLPMSDPLY